MFNPAHSETRLQNLGIPAIGRIHTSERTIPIAHTVIDEIAELGGSAEIADTRIAHALISLGFQVEQMPVPADVPE